MNFNVYAFCKGHGVLTEDYPELLIKVELSDVDTSIIVNPLDVGLNIVRRDYAKNVTPMFGFVLPKEESAFNNFVQYDAFTLDELDNLIVEYSKGNCPHCNRALSDVGVNLSLKVSLEYVPVEGGSNDIESFDSVDEWETAECCACGGELDCDGIREYFFDK